MYYLQFALLEINFTSALQFFLNFIMSEFANAMVTIEEQTIVIQGTCQWTIPDFAMWMNTMQPSGQPFTSPEFQIRSVLPVPVSKFQIRVNRSSSFSDISFQLKNAGACPIRVLDLSVCTRSQSTATTSN